MKKITKDDIGRKVIFVDKNAHDSCPDFYPEVGTIGSIYNVDNGTIYVKWASGSTSGDDIWATTLYRIEFVQEIPDISDEEIVKMLLPKFKKNGINIPFVCLGNILVEMIALAYRSGYVRGQKGRPFKIQPKKVKNECK